MLPQCTEDASAVPQQCWDKTRAVVQWVPAIVTVLHSALPKIESSELRLGKDFTWSQRKKSKVERVNFSRAPHILLLALLLDRMTASPPKYKIQKPHPVRLKRVESAKIPTREVQS